MAVEPSDAFLDLLVSCIVTLHEQSEGSVDAGTPNLDRTPLAIQSDSDRSRARRRRVRPVHLAVGQLVPVNALGSGGFRHGWRSVARACAGVLRVDSGDGARVSSRLLRLQPPLSLLFDRRPSLNGRRRSNSGPRLWFSHADAATYRFMASL